MFRRKPKLVALPEFLFVGLGNPGGEYDGTRHNVGFEVIKELCARHRIKATERKFQANFGVGMFGADSSAVVLARPLTYMNESGVAVKALQRHFGIVVKNIVLIFDDMDLEVGRVKMQPHGGAGSHNGIKSLVSSLGTQEFPRIKIGIGKPSVSGIDHVLTRFHSDEIPTVVASIRRAADGCELIVSSGIDIAMNRINIDARDEQ